MFTWARRRPARPRFREPLAADCGLARQGAGSGVGGSQAGPLEGASSRPCSASASVPLPGPRIGAGRLRGQLSATPREGWRNMAAAGAAPGARG